MHCHIRCYFKYWCSGTKPGHQTGLSFKAIIFLHVFRKVFACLHIPKQLYRYTAVMPLYKKKKKSLYKVPGFPGWRNPVAKKDEWCLLILLFTFSGGWKLWEGCKFGGSWGFRSDGRAQKVHCWAGNLSWEGLSQESPRGWQWNAIAEQRETLPHLGLPSSPPQARPPASSAGAGWPSALNHRVRQSSTQGERLDL